MTENVITVKADPNLSIMNSANDEYRKMLEENGNIKFLNTTIAGIPTSAFSFITPTITQQLFAPLSSNKIAKREQVGQIGTKDVYLMKEELIGNFEQSDLFGELSNNKADYNFSFERRGVFYAGLSLEKNMIKEEVYNNITKKSYNHGLDKAFQNSYEQFKNNAFFYGIGSPTADAPILGYINDPRVTVQAAATGNWATTDITNIDNDIFTAYQKLVEQTKGLVNEYIKSGKGRLVLSIASSKIGYLTKRNEYSTSFVGTLLKEENIVAVPQLVSAYTGEDGFILELVVDELSSLTNATVIDLYPLNVVNSSSGNKQAFLSSTVGCVSRYPIFRVVVSGI